MVEKSSKVDIKKRSAAYNQERIDAEIIAAKVSAESLAARKRIIIQRRSFVTVLMTLFQF